MTAATGPIAPPSALRYDTAAVSDASPRSFWQNVLHNTVGSIGARIGLVWIFILVFAAIFAPLIANTQPLLLKTDGQWSVPFLHYLTPTDVCLFIFAAAVLIVTTIARRMSLRKRALAVLLTVILSIPLSHLLIHPPLTIDWQHYRDLQRAGRAQACVMTLLPYSANDYLRDYPDSPLQPPSFAHPMGTEANGADVLSRMIWASRIALSIGLISTGIAVVIGIVVGGIMGYFAGTADLLGMRLIEIFEAIPTLFLLITFVAFFGRDLYIMMAIIGLTTWTGDARFIRAEFLRLRGQDFVQAAVAAGLPLPSILFRHLLPNGISPILVTTSFGIASAILYESTLSFLGLGPVGEPSWGQMLSQAAGVGGTFIWWIAFFPGLAIFLTVFAYNLIGEALRDALDPKLRKRD